jgi:hypothetical protein
MTAGKYKYQPIRWTLDVQNRRLAWWGVFEPIPAFRLAMDEMFV